MSDHFLLTVRTSAGLGLGTRGSGVLGLGGGWQSLAGGTDPEPLTSLSSMYADLSTMRGSALTPASSETGTTENQVGWLGEVGCRVV